jgi:outer membrane protein assembly factor BamB
MNYRILPIVFIGICHSLIPNTLAQDLRTSEPSKDQPEAISKEKAAQELWRHRTSSDITLHRPLPSGDLFVSSDKATMLLSADKGQVVWSRDDIVGCKKDQEHYRLLLPTCKRDGKLDYRSFLGRYLRLESRVPGYRPVDRLFAGRDEEPLLLVDMETGKTAFDTSTFGFKRVHGTCLLETEGTLIAWEERDKGPALAAAFDLSAGKTLWTGELPLAKKLACLPLDGGRLALVNGESERGKRRVFAIESSTGRARWESVELARNEWGKRPMVLAVTESSAVVSVDKSGTVSIDLRAGGVQWRNNDFSGEPAADAFMNRENRLYLARKKLLAALDLTTGSVVWKREELAASHLIPTRYGLLALGGSLHLLRYENGESVWPKSVGFDHTAWLLDADDLFFIGNKKLRHVAIETGVEREFGAVEFQGKESPADIDLLGDTLLVLSSQNIVAFARDGRVLYQRYYQAPGLSALEKTLMVATAAGMTYMNARMAASSARSTARDAAFLRGGTGTGSAFYNAPILSLGSHLGTRIRATTNAERFIYMFTEQPDDTGRKGFSLVRLDKRDGRETGRLWLLDRRPNFSIDPFASRVFVKTGDAEITAYAFATVK